MLARALARDPAFLVLDQGALVEAGSHRELLSRGGPYAALVEGQLEGAAGQLERESA